MLREPTPRLLFVPVSGPLGMGEYARALAMAQAVRACAPAAVIHFAVSRQAPYAMSVPFETTQLPSSATFHSAQIAALVAQFHPTTVLFDNAGRTAQLRAARAAGARVIFVSARPRQRRRAFRLHWMRLIDEHWIAYPQLLAGAPSVLERARLWLMGRPQLSFLNPILPPDNAQRSAAVLAREGLRAGEFVAVIPGGGTEHAGAAAALDAMVGAARQLALSGLTTVLVGLEYKDQVPPGLRVLARLPLDELTELMRAARLVIANGGYTLLQAIACDRPAIGIALMKDQIVRIGRCAAAGIAVQGVAAADALAAQSRKLLDDDVQLAAMRSARAQAQIGNDAEKVARALLGLKPRRLKPE